MPLEPSPRAGQPFATINCSALPETLFESELFGYERGAFTGAHAASPGRLQAAQGGTVFLDEVGELSLAMQPKLLRVIDQQRLGGRRYDTIDVRWVAATNRACPGRSATACSARTSSTASTSTASPSHPFANGPETSLPWLRRFWTRSRLTDAAGCRSAHRAASGSRNSGRQDRRRSDGAVGRGSTAGRGGHCFRPRLCRGASAGGPEPPRPRSVPPAPHTSD